MNKCPFQPTSDGYGTEEQKTARSTSVPGPMGFNQPGLARPVILVRVKWILKASDFIYLSNFYNLNSSSWFLIDLLTDAPAVEEHTAMFSPGTFKLTGKDGDTRICEATLEVLSIERGDSYYNQVFSFKDVPEPVYAAVTHLVTVALPLYMHP